MITIPEHIQKSLTWSRQICLWNSV